MKPEEQNRAIAKWLHPTASDAWIEGFLDGQNDFSNDLNAMHEAEKRLGCEEHKVFRDTLYMLVSHSPYDRAELAISSTAAQRAEALLRTIGKWHDSTLHTKG